ncbi:MAG: hypothetical protein HY823_04080 [Acidobacteria bacterium]|nr:hypothetical protein [Acidobacteriota bacterium]
MFRRHASALFAHLFAFLALLGALACTEDLRGKQPPQASYTHEPVLMTYEELRSSFAVQGPRDIVKNGKILRFGDLLFVTERYEGIHVIDNADPAHPAPKAFLRIPGTVDMACRDGVLYADNTVDLLAIEITGTPMRVLKRMEWAFPWDPYQAVDDPRVTFPWDVYAWQSRGVVVGARPRS